MDIYIKGRRVLSGEVSASGAKNSALPLFFSTLLAEGVHTFSNVPRVKDIETAGQILKSLGCQVQWKAPHVIEIEVPAQLKSYQAHYDLMRTMRAGVLSLGPLTTRFRQAQVSLPGGCAIGSRSVAWHIHGLNKMGADLCILKGYIQGTACSRLHGAEIIFEQPTVGGTQNLMMAAALAEGETRIHHAAKEPEVVDLAEYLNKMGACVKGAGTSLITIQGKEKLQPANHTVIPDRIETATLLIAAAITRGQVTIHQCCPLHLQEVILKLKESGFQIQTGENWIQLHSPKEISSVSLSTAPYPGFPTDVQAQFIALMTGARGESCIEECIFENRFMHVPELIRLKADILIHQRQARIRGPRKLEGAVVTSADLRAGACLVLAGLAAEGETRVRRIYHLDRGYEKLEEKLTSLGACIQRR